MNENGIKERGNDTKGYSPSITLVPTYLNWNENQSFVVRKEMGNYGNLCSRRIVALVPTHLTRAQESERHSSAHYG
jgi:hypothetical protein